MPDVNTFFKIFLETSISRGIIKSSNPNERNTAVNNEFLIRLVKDNLNEFVKWLDKNDLSQDPINKTYFVSAEGIKFPFLVVAAMWEKEQQKL